MSGNVVDRGLEGVVVGETVLSNVEGQVGRLTYRGYDIHDLAVNATFEEVVHLLLYGDVPTQVQLTRPQREARPVAGPAAGPDHDPQGDSAKRVADGRAADLRLGAGALSCPTAPTAFTKATPTPR